MTWVQTQAHSHPKTGAHTKHTQYIYTRTLTLTYTHTHAHAWSCLSLSVVIPKASSLNRIKENTQVFDWSLTEDHMRELATLNDNYHCTWNPEGIV